jgi:hypothetical protein
MDDVVAIKASFADGSTRYCMTWGRPFDAVDPNRLLDAVRPHLGSVDEEGVSLRVCDTLQEASATPYFFEALIHFSQRPIPFGAGYETWAEQKRDAIQRGKEIYFLGTRRTGSRARRSQGRAHVLGGIHPAWSHMSAADQEQDRPSAAQTT